MFQGRARGQRDPWFRGPETRVSLATSQGTETIASYPLESQHCLWHPRASLHLDLSEGGVAHRAPWAPGAAHSVLCIHKGSFHQLSSLMWSLLFLIEVHSCFTMMH